MIRTWTVYYIISLFIYEFILSDSQSVVYFIGSQTTGFILSRVLKLCIVALIILGPQYGHFFISPFWRLSFWSVSYFSFEISLKPPAFVRLSFISEVSQVLRLLYESLAAVNLQTFILYESLDAVNLQTFILYESLDAVNLQTFILYESLAAVNLQTFILYESLAAVNLQTFIRECTVCP